MRRSYGLVFCALFYMAVAEPSADELKNKINETNRKVDELLQKIHAVKVEVKRMNEEFRRKIAPIEGKIRNLEAEEADILRKLRALNDSYTDVTHWIIIYRERVKYETAFTYRFKFIIALLTGDIGLLKYRRQNGDEETCYRFAQNSTEGRRRRKNEVELLARSLSKKYLTTKFKNELILTQFLNEAKYRLAKAYDAYVIEKEILDTQRAINTKKYNDAKSLENLIRKYVKEALRALELLRRDIQGRWREMKRLIEEYKLKEKLNKELIARIRQLRREYGGYSRAITCYEEIENAKYGEAPQ